MDNHRDNKGKDLEIHKHCLGALMVVGERQTLQSMVCSQKCSERREQFSGDSWASDGY